MDELPGALVLGLPEELRRGSVLDDLAHQLRVEGRGRLVEEQQLGSQREGADDPDSLLLPAGQRRRMARLLGPEAGPAEQLAGLCDRDRPRASLNNDRAFDDVLKDGLVREEVVVLEDDRAPVTQSVQLGAAGARREVDHLPVSRLDAAGVGGLQNERSPGAQRTNDPRTDPRLSVFGRGNGEGNTLRVANLNNGPLRDMEPQSI